MPIPLLADGRFSVREISERMSRPPRKPTFLRRYVNYTYNGIRTTTVDFRIDDKALLLVPTTERGAPPYQNARDQSRFKTIKVPHISIEGHVTADEIQGVAILTDTNDFALRTVQSAVDDEALSLRERIEDTIAFHELGAFQGRILDADGTRVVVDMFAELGVTQTVISFALGDVNTDLSAKCRQVRIAMLTGMYGDAMTGIVGFCGQNFYDQLLLNKQIIAAQTTTVIAQAVASINVDGGGEEAIVFGGIKFVLALGSVAGQPFVAANECRFGPTGTGVYRGAFAPGTFLDAVNQKGQPFYGKTRAEDYDRGIGVLAESNPLPYMRRPEALIKGTVA